jgi:hypothetical protein
MNLVPIIVTLGSATPQKVSFDYDGSFIDLSLILFREALTYIILYHRLLRFLTARGAVRFASRHFYQNIVNLTPIAIPFRRKMPRKAIVN